MSTSQPLVCASLQLPPDPQPFLNVCEISQRVFSPNLEDLRLVLEESRDVNPEAVQIFYETRKILREELLKVFKVLEYAQEVAQRYYKVIEALEGGKPALEVLHDVGFCAQIGMQYSEEGQQAMSVFRRELEKSIERVTATTGGKHKEGSKFSLTSTQNIQLVSEIFTAVDECKGLLQQCHDQFAQLDKQTRDEKSIDSDPPSGEETQMMRAKWQTYFDTVGGVWIHGVKVADGILYPEPDLLAPRIHKPKQNVPLWRTLFRRQDKHGLVRSENVREAQRERIESSVAAITSGNSHEVRANAINPVDATERLETPEDTAPLDAASSNGQATNKSKVLFWRKVFRRVNSSSPRDVSGRVEATNAAPDTTAPLPQVSLWRKLFSWATCASKTPLR